MDSILDLILSNISKYLLGDNTTLLQLRKVSQYFEQKRNFWFGQLVLNYEQRRYLFLSNNFFCDNVVRNNVVQKTKFFNLSNTEITDVRMLERLHTLQLHFCTQITDVSMLGKLHTLSLIGCTGITDISMLGGLHILNLHGCIGITDVSMLGKLHTLFLYGCTGITDVSMLNGVKNLHK